MNFYEEVARTLMSLIAHDCGANSRLELKASFENQPPKHVKNITEKASVFFGRYPDYINDESLEDIAIGEESEKNIRYGSLTGFSELDQALNDYFDDV